MDELKNIIANIGATAEISYLYYRACLKSGASPGEAILLSKIFFEVMFDDARRKGEDNVE